jgi:hypothetical protein
MASQTPAPPPKASLATRLFGPKRPSTTRFLRFPEEAIEQLESLLTSYRRLRKGQPLPGCDEVVSALETKLKNRGGQQIWWTDVVQAEMCLLEATDDDDLVARLHGWRARLHDVIGDARFAVYLSNAPTLTGSPDPKKLRADLGECIRTVYYFYSAYGVSARSRNRATISAMRTAAVILALQFVAWLILLVLHTQEHWPSQFDTFRALELLLATSAAGVLGSVVSVQRRVQDPTADSDPFYRYIQTNGDWVGIAIVSPVLGAIFGMVMYGLLAAKLILDTVVRFDHGYPNSPQTVALVVILGFIAGFAEQLIPDALNRVAARALSSVSPTSNPGSAAGPQPVPPTVTAIDPPSGPAGKAVTITGTGFSAPGLAVTFGSVPATGAVNQGDTTIKVASPPGTGTVDVIVTTRDGTSKPSDATKYGYA